jgi:hypothetical protein
MPASLYKPAVVNIILERLKAGENLTDICTDESLPKAQSVIQWAGKYPEFKKKYTEARYGKKPKTGRPAVVIDNEVANLMLQRISQGETVTQVCKTKGFPALSTFYHWVANGNEQFQANFRRARISQANSHVEKCVDIADEATEIIKNLEDPRHSSAIAKITTDRIRARQWVASRLHPQGWSERQNLDISGGVKVLKPDELKKSKKKAGLGVQKAKKGKNATKN